MCIRDRKRGIPCKTIPIITAPNSQTLDVIELHVGVELSERIENTYANVLRDIAVKVTVLATSMLLVE